MKTIYNDTGMVLRPEDGRDRVFMKEVLRTGSGKVFCKVLPPKEEGGDPALLLTAFDPSKRHNSELEGQI